MNEISTYFRPLEKSEVPEIELPVIDFESRRKNLELCTELIGGILYFQRRRKLLTESIETFAGTFPELRAKYINQLDTVNRCIVRMHERYNKIKATL